MNLLRSFLLRAVTIENAIPQMLEPIYYPEAYSGGALGHGPTPREILDAALAAPRARFFAPPAGESATGA